MAILLYCISKSESPTVSSLSGVAGDPVVRVAIGNLAAFTSSNPDKSNWLRPQLQTSALEFHRVLSQLFESTVIVPFRFPTVFDNEEQLIQRLEERSRDYSALLEKFRDMVQMEIRITNPDLKKPAESGTQYLKLRQSATARIETFTAEVRATLSHLSHDWRQRPSKEGTRAFVLIGRKEVAEFRSKLLHTPVPRELTVRASGPWPVSEFIEQG